LRCLILDEKANARVREFIRRVSPETDEVEFVLYLTEADMKKQQQELLKQTQEQVQEEKAQPQPQQEQTRSHHSTQPESRSQGHTSVQPQRTEQQTKGRSEEKCDEIILMDHIASNRLSALRERTMTATLEQLYSKVIAMVMIN